MDYDDNDFEGQNLHLGEGTSKFSTVLHSYALPKFDFDYGLQSHLRFDSLVENEVFLGIPSQEDNQWIEDFSRGNSAIEFSSSAAESCSISRRTNVWSEATSSESVEMLLKSVGQEGMVPGDTIIEESDACGELGGLTEGMDHHLKQDDEPKNGMDSEPGGVASFLNPSVTSETRVIFGTEGVDRKRDDANQVEVDNPLDDSHNIRLWKNSPCPGSQIDGTVFSSQDIAAASVQFLKTQESKHRVSENSTDNTNGLLLDTGKPAEDQRVLGKKADVDDRFLEGINVSAGSHNLEDLHCPSEVRFIEQHIVGSGISNIEESFSFPPKGESNPHIDEGCSDDLNLRNPLSENSTGNTNGLLLDTGKPEEDQRVLGKKADVDDQILDGINVSTGSHNLEDLHCSSEVRFIEQHMVGSGIRNIEETFSFPPKGESNPHIDEGCSDDLNLRNPEKASKCEPVDSSHFHRQFKENMHKDIGVEVHSNIEGIDIEVMAVEDEIPSSSESMIDQTTFREDRIVEGKAYLQGSYNQFGNKVSVSSSEASLMPEVDKKLFDGQGDGISNHVGDLLNLATTCSSTEMIGKHAVENLGLGDASRVHTEDSNAEDHALSPIAAGLMQTYELTIISNSNEMQSNQDVSFDERENIELPNDLSTTDSDIVGSLSSVKGVEPLSEGDDLKVDTSLAYESECLTTDGNDPVVGAPLLCGTGAAADKGSHHLVKSTKIGRESPEDTNLSSLKEEGSQGSSELCPVLQSERGVSQRSTGKLLHKNFDQSRLTLETRNLASGIEQSVESVHTTGDQSLPVVETCITSRSEQALKAKESSPTTSSKLEICLTLSDSAVKEGSSAEGLVPVNREEADVQKNHEVAPSVVAVLILGEDVSANSAKPDFGIPTISSFVLSQNEEEKEGVKDPTSEIVTLTEVSVQSTSLNARGDNSAKNESVHPSSVLSEKEATKDGESVSAIQTCKKTMIVEESPSTPIRVQMDIVSELYSGSSQAPDGEIASEGSKGTPEPKVRRAPGRATRKENIRRGSHVKETTLGNVQYCGTISRGVISIPTSNLPDLNTSAPPSVSFNQAFTDLQQVQLRAQIFVYGSLIQRIAPDEACMVSAFGASDGGRSVWEPVWRSCMERIQGQKSHPNKYESPVQPRSGSRSSDKPIKRAAHQSKLAPSPLGQASSTDTPSPVSNCMIPLSSPLWNISTPGDGLQSSGMPRTGVLDYQQTRLPIHPFQATPTQGFVGHNWLSQTYFPGPWNASPPQTSAFDANARLSLSPMTETVKLTPLKESSGLVTAEAKHASPITFIHSSGPGGVAETSSLSDMRKTTVLPTLNSTSPKARKRKKVNVFEDLGRISLLAQAQTESVPAPVITNHLSTSVVVSTPNFFPSKGGTSKLSTSVVPSSSTDYSKTVELNPKQNAISEDTLSKVEEAKHQADDAETFASAAVSHSLSVWSQLDKHKISGLSPDVEDKLASAAVAVAAAASVAKVAAAAAKIASNVALQAKMMADEALASGRTSNPVQSTSSSLYAVNNFANTSLASILMGGNMSTSSSSMLVAAKEVARKRVEAASAASKQAENLDAVLKAAELAAEAVSQAGKTVAMGDSLVLSKLVEAGPEGYWRVPQLPPEQGVISNNGNREQSRVHSSENCPNGSEEGLSEEPKTLYSGLPLLSAEVPRESMEDHVRAEDGLSSSLTTREANSRAKRSCTALDMAKTIGVVPESEVESRVASITAQDEYDKVSVEDRSVKEGCLVEVLKDGFKTAWYSANVLSLKDGKAFVSYTELQSDEGSEKLREWVALEGEANNAPIVRIAHHIATTHFEGTRKRRRAAMGDYQWLVGDRVDVWMQDCWREGVLTEKQKDETKLMVHFPAEGETSVVKSWHLRPTLIWQDGEWIEWSRPREKDPSAQGDTPREKRLKLGIPAINNRENDKLSKNIGFVESDKPDESRLLLSARDKVFNIGKNIGDRNKPRSVRTLRTGLQKEESIVVSGVAKPGKKRKFMEVSKHYVAERRSKTNESNDSVKFTKYLMPQGSGPRGWKNTKVVGKEKPAAESKGKVAKSGKSVSVLGRIPSQKDKVSAQNDGSAMNHTFNDSGSTVENVSQKQSLMEFGSFSKREGSAEGQVLFSSLALSSDAPSKKTSTSNASSERGNGRKLAHYSGKFATGDVDKLDDGNPGKSISEGVEPRRSNRRIQPTSRLLEGLQSSLVIPKFPAVSHDKSHRSNIPKPRVTGGSER